MPKNQTIPERFDALRRRAGLSFDQLAKGMGYRGGSSVQRYLDPESFTKTALPLEVAQRAADALVGRGDPPITKTEVMSLTGFGNEPNHGELTNSIRNMENDFTTILDGREAMPTEALVDLLATMIATLPAEAVTEVIKRAYADLVKRGNELRPPSQARTS